MCWLSRCGLESHLFPYVPRFVRLLLIELFRLQHVRLPTKPANWATQRRGLQSSARIWNIRLCFFAKYLWTRPWCKHAPKIDFDPSFIAETFQRDFQHHYEPADFGAVFQPTKAWHSVSVFQAIVVMYLLVSSYCWRVIEVNKGLSGVPSQSFRDAPGLKLLFVYIWAIPCFSMTKISIITGPLPTMPSPSLHQMLFIFFLNWRSCMYVLVCWIALFEYVSCRHLSKYNMLRFLVLHEFTLNFRFLETTSQFFQWASSIRSFRSFLCMPVIRLDHVSFLTDSTRFLVP